MLKVYTYAKCDRCRRALKFLSERGIAFEVKPIRETPPSPAELKAMFSAYGNIRKLFNVSGAEYRVLGLSGKLSTMSEAETFKLLARHGNLVKRPFLSGDGLHLVGFDQAEWQARFPNHRENVNA